MRPAPILLALALWMAPACGAEAIRTIDFTTVLLDQDDQPIMVCGDDPPPKDGDCKVRRQITLGLAAQRALSAPEPGLSGEGSFKRGQLGLMVYRATAAQLTVDELKLIKDQVGKVWGPLIVARAFPLLDPATAAKK